jgi:hypothetical protein
MNAIEKPKYRHLLKARIHECGFKTIKDFSKTIDADPNRISKNNYSLGISKRPTSN